jgi:hypothetical protein
MGITDFDKRTWPDGWTGSTEAGAAESQALRASGEYDSIHLGTTHDTHDALQGLRLRDTLGAYRFHCGHEARRQCA